MTVPRIVRDGPPVTPRGRHGVRYRRSLD